MTRRTAVFAGFWAALLTAVGSLAGILWPLYAKETASLAAQGLGQDWVDLVVVAPFLAIASLLALRGSPRALLLLGGGLGYTAYTYAVYAFGIHFNALFLVYCAALGVSVFGVIAVLTQPIGFTGGPARAAGWTQLAIALVFALLWLSDIVPAIVHGGVPKVVADERMVTNPVHVLDLSIVLPALAISGVSALRGRLRLSPVLLTLALLMSVAIGGMVIAVRLSGLPADLTVSAVFAVVAIGCGVVLAGLLRRDVRVLASESRAGGSRSAETFLESARHRDGGAS